MSKKLTTSEYKEKLKEARGEEVTLLSEYEGSTKPIKVRFNSCGHIVTINKPYNLLNGSNCIICKNKSSRLTTFEFKKRIANTLGKDYQLIGEYKTSRIKVTIKHLVCGKEYKTSPKNALDGLGCPYCSKKAMWSTDKFKAHLAKKYGDEYEVLGDYTGSSKKIEVKHTKCGNVWYPTPANLLSGRSHCPKCSALRLSKNSRLSHSEIQQRISRLFRGTIVLTNPEEYQNMETSLHYKCLVCGYKGTMMAKNLIEGHGCPKCANLHRNDRNRLTADYISDKTKEITNNTYEFIGGDYRNSYSPIKFKHLDCGTIFTTTWNKFSSGAVNCPRCRGSRGEQLVKGYLDNCQLSYEYGYVVPDLKDKRNLHFDFWLPQYRIAIEYDGIQHYKETQFNYGSDNNFKLTKLHDKMKNNYCYKHSITLIRIPYYENVNDFLEQNLQPLLSIKRGKYQLVFKSVDSKDLIDLMERYHYLHRKTPFKYGYGLYVNNILMGMITYTTPNKTTVAKSFNSSASIYNTLELSRLYIKDEVSQNIKNITSKFVAWTLRQLKQEQDGNWFIISFADQGMHHTGSIYQATNFLYCGKSKPTGEFAWGGERRYRERWRAGAYYRYLIQPTLKYRYITFVGSKTFKKRAKNSLKLDIEPYPKQDSIHYSVGETEERLIRDRETGKIWKESELVKHLKKD